MPNCCLHCGADCGDSKPFCVACGSAAEAALAARRDRPACYHCAKPFAYKTLAAHGGICGRCSALHPLGIEEDRKDINNQLQRVVWMRYRVSDMITQDCYCCGVQDISVFSFQCGHVKARAEGGPTTVSNLRPICAPCNQGMGKIDMREFVREHGFEGRMMAELKREGAGSKMRPADSIEVVPVGEATHVAATKEKSRCVVM